ncbi:hypothetical protein GYMLUDRAFT_44993 [Collybiopsis luxurians FD-317 M1]|uniref:Pyranose dehydrogenase (acceptor) n=1 Tax=Collybiopsis luxurians FD-317 M1 TaxID=944289 RepID=A0A0D0CKL8_9AGAR|nr:hypothetical protein GYMLUDRAFT_44993 [Collybiopsis luxurians FD-317 M1]
MQISRLILIIWHIFGLPLCFAKVYNNFRDLPSKHYDFVIVGGGTAGNVVANRLTENPNFSVLVLEAGGTNANAFEIEVPYFSTRGVQPQFDWNYSTIPQNALNDRLIPMQRGFVLGGSSSVNRMFYTRGSADDYDRFAAVTGDEGWSWKGVQKYLAMNEKFERPADRHNISGQFNPSVHSFTGINAVSLPGFAQNIDSMVFDAVAELGGIFHFNEDYNSGKPLGFSWLQRTVTTQGHRSSSATSYLAPEFIERKNLDVVLNTRVSRVIPSRSNQSSSGLAFRTVEFVHDLDGPRFTVEASKEVILSGGVFGSAHILLNSGIGNSTMLSRLGISPLVNLPSVGQNLTDHPIVETDWLVNSTQTMDDINRNTTVSDEDEAEFNKTGMGPLVDSSAGNQIAFFRVDESLTERYGDPSAGRDSPHLEMIPGNGWSGIPPATGNFFSLGIAVVSPASRGSMTINSTDPFAPPLINPGYFSSPFDIAAMRQAMRIALKYASAPTWKGYILSPFGALANITAASDDDVLDEYIQNSTFSLAHPVGTVAMSAKGADYGVVDPDLRVKGVEGLRVVDASVFPFITSAHTQAPAYVIGERGAELIKANYERG